jgi:phosphoribosylanthranilate isomerase
VEEDPVIESNPPASLFPAGPVIKICGLTRVDDVVLAARLGAWAVGFVFAPSPRRLTPHRARALIVEAAALLSGTGAVREGAARSGLPLTVGVFGDVSADEIAETAEDVGLDAVQLHGPATSDGSAAAAVRAALHARNGSTSRASRVLIIQAVAVPAGGADPGALQETVAAAEVAADVVLLDSKMAGRFGGTGTSFAWPLARAAAGGCPLLVAGGITPDNVATALVESGAWGVDVSSGVELTPGVKDPERLVRLFAHVRCAHRSQEG